eukprot:gnl/MRDRNA2_/MRDRNA2_30940_c0_seq1.p1 gnl/MRDRNA2_/MRDRNA2_30940_c0~~gnl/MRDRNA2_/MRDRNA2_30940_c0_seq1.p1  ORF type:complete len:394 (-),score=83.19 gnl/MRDRNA2_/MRDRNA2_30940_c0_seq1:108-1289(-)
MPLQSESSGHLVMDRGSGSGDPDRTPHGITAATNPDEVAGGLSDANADVRSSAHSSADVPSEKVVVWFSLDPRLGALVFYPQEAAEKLETMYRDWSSGNPGAEANLGDSFCGAVVSMNNLGGGGEVPTAIQRTSRGRRDVQRSEFLSGDSHPMTVAVHGVRTERGWRMTKDDDPHAEELSAGFAPGMALTVDTRLPVTQIVSACTGTSASSAAPAGDPTAAQRLSPGDGEAALWEWCRHVTQSIDSLPDDAWGVYAGDINGEIEAAYLQDAESIEIEVGVRKYQIVFGEAFGQPGTARQIDQVYRKRRHVRRRIVSVIEWDEKFQPAETEGEDAECAICFQEFAETRTMPVLKTRECGHRFHAACIQNLIDTGAPCPYCRCNVDWKNASLNEV